MNENENTTTQNPCDTVKAVLRGRFIAIQAYLKKQEKSQINNLTLQRKQKAETLCYFSILLQYFSFYFSFFLSPFSFN